MQYKYTEAYNSIKAPADLKSKIFASTAKKKHINFKALISIAACVIILLGAFPTYVNFTDPHISVSPNNAAIKRQVTNGITLELELDRSTEITVSHGTIENYDGSKIKGNTSIVWDIGIADYHQCRLTLKDSFKTTVYALDYNENNDSWSIIKI